MLLFLFFKSDRLLDFLFDFIVPCTELLLTILYGGPMVVVQLLSDGGSLPVGSDCFGQEGFESVEASRILTHA